MLLSLFSWKINLWSIGLTLAITESSACCINGLSRLVFVCVVGTVLYYGISLFAKLAMKC